MSRQSWWVVSACEWGWTGLSGLTWLRELTWCYCLRLRLHKVDVVRKSWWTVNVGLWVLIGLTWLDRVDWRLQVQVQVHTSFIGMLLIYKVNCECGSEGGWGGKLELSGRLVLESEDDSVEVARRVEELIVLELGWGWVRPLRWRDRVVVVCMGEWAWIWWVDVWKKSWWRLVWQIKGDRVDVARLDR